MTNNKLIYGFCLGMIMLVTACQKDEQNFNYEKLNEVSIKAENSSLSVTSLDSLKIQPQITESNPGTDTYTYQWTLYPIVSSGPEDRKILSTEKDLNVRIEASPDEYNIQYKVTNVRTGVASFFLYRLSVNGAFYEGWLVSNNKQNNAVLSFIRADDVVFMDPASDVNNHTYSGKAINAAAVSRTLFGDVSLLLFFTDQGIYRFNLNDFVQNGTTRDLIPDSDVSPSFSAYNANKYMYDQYIVYNGGVHVGFGPGIASSPADILKPYTERLTGDYTLFPAVIPSSSGGTLFYDNKNKRFMQISLISRTITAFPSVAPADPNPDNKFNMGNVGKTMIAWDYGVQNPYGSDQVYFIMEDQNGRYLYLVSGIAPTSSQIIENSPEINIATAFATSGRVKHMYYAANNKIYLYDMMSKSAKLVYSFPSGLRISDLKMERSTSTRVVAAVNQGTAGSVYYFDLDNLGDFVGNTYAKKFDGFGEIANLSYRNPS